MERIGSGKAAVPHVSWKSSVRLWRAPPGSSRTKGDVRAKAARKRPAPTAISRAFSAKGKTGKPRPQEEDGNERENTGVFRRGRKTREERREANEREPPAETTFDRRGDTRGHEEQKGNLGRREVGLSRVLIGNRDEEGSEETCPD